VPDLVRRIGTQDIALLSHDECTTVHVVARMVGRRRLGFAAGIARGEGLLRERLTFDPRISPYEHAMDLVRRVCPQVLPLARVAPVIEPPDGWLAQRGIDGPYGVVHVGAATALQRWEAARFIDTARHLSAVTRYPWLIIDMAAKLSLPGLGGLIGRARGFVGNHSGPLHLAAALGVPWVAVAGPSARAWDPPWTDVPGRVLRADMPCVGCGRLGAPVRECPNNTPGACLDALTAEQVAGAMLEILESRAHDRVVRPAQLAGPDDPCALSPAGR
jgi:ADP-heptose:LPS heptosyltransferase